MEDQIAKSKLNSIGDGKRGAGTGVDHLQQYDWGHAGGGDTDDRINNARTRRLEEEILQLRKERLVQQSEPSQTAFVKSIEIPL